jgi:Spy/CpxP family protein refolding chaperone
MDGRFWDELGLNEEQREQMSAIRDAHRSAMKAWRDANPEATEAERREFREQLHQSGRKAMEDILTAEQLEAFDEHTQQMRDRGRKHGRGRGGHGGPGMGGPGMGGRGMGTPGLNLDRLADRLDLTPEQVGKIAELRARERENFKNGVAEILTPEQLEEWNRMKQRWAR